MPPLKSANGTIIILDVGRNVALPEDKKGKSFFENALECAKRIIERKIISQGKDIIGMILLGTQKTKNSLADQCPGAFKHIELYSELQPPAWNLLRKMPDQPQKGKGDWIDAIIVAADHFKNGVSGYKFANRKVILMTNFEANSKFNTDNIDEVLNGLKEDDFQIDIIGIDVSDENRKGEDYDLARQFVEATSGVTASFDYAMSYLLFHRKKAVNSSPWNTDLSFGPNIKIPISTYIRLKDEPAVKNSWNRAVKDPETNAASITESIDKKTIHINTEAQSVVDKPNIIKGYHYGQTIIPLTEDDELVLYKSGNKCLSVYGFTSANNIGWQNLSGDGIYYLFGRKDDAKAQLAIRCLVECLHELKLVGIVRRVYNDNNAPKMFILMPVIDPQGFTCLSMIETCFKEDIKYMSFPSVNYKQFTHTKKQVEGFKELIKAMDLTTAYDDTYDDAEAFPTGESVNPYKQYILDCIAFRAMNPDKPLPEPREEILSLFKVPPLVEKRSKETLQGLKQLFTLNKVEKKVRKKVVVEPTSQVMDTSNNDTDPSSIPKVQLIMKNEITKIGTLTPIEDFKNLAQGNTLADLAPQLTSCIEKLMYCNLDGKYAKGLETMTFFRAESVNIDPACYNNWLREFKKVLLRDNKKDILTVIVENKLNFILKVENESSTYETEDSHEESQLYENDTQPICGELSIGTEINDMFDDM